MLSEEEKIENVKAIGLFFSGYNDRKVCKLTYKTDSIIVNYPRTKDSWASDFIADRLRVGLTSAPSV